MTPYGIVYEENLFSLEQSVNYWHKKYGVMKKKSLLKIALILLVFYAVIAAVSFIIGKDFYYVILAVTLLITNLVLFPIYVKNSFVKPTTRANFQRGEKQIVLFGDRLEYTTPYGKSVYYYDEIMSAQESEGLLTIVVDTAAMPISVSEGSLKKGEYQKFLFILEGLMGARLERKERKI